jgi:hypothetical protein
MKLKNGLLVSLSASHFLDPLGCRDFKDIF